jgi:hypothetical protein
MKIRAYVFLANTNKKASLKVIRKSIGMEQPVETDANEPPETAAEKIKRLTGLDIACCPKCGERLVPNPLPRPERPP